MVFGMNGVEWDYVEIRYIEGVGFFPFKPMLEFEKCLCVNGASYCDEVLDDVVKHETLMKLIDRAEYIYQFENANNLYGHFLFIGLALRFQNEIIPITFYGLGYDEYKDKYIVDKWGFYWANTFVLEERVDLTKEEIKKKIEERRKEVKKLAKEHKQSKTGKLYEAIASLTDQDGAITLMEDFELF